MQKTHANIGTPACKCAPNLYLAANFLEPDDKYRAFLAARSAMQSVDGLTGGDGRSGKLTRRVKDQILSQLDRFVGMFRNRRFDDSLPHTQDLKLAIARFSIPNWPFTRMAEAMKINLENDRFDTCDQMMSYLLNSGLSPAAIFWHLAGCSFDERGQITLPAFDIEEAAEPMAAFCTLAHIITDFKDDYLSETEPFIYFDLETTEMFHISDVELEETAKSGQQSLKFTKMIQWYYNRLTAFQTAAENKLDELADQLPSDGRFALNLIFAIYSIMTEKISRNEYNIVGDNLNLTVDDIQAAAEKALARSGISSDEISDRLDVLLAAQKTGVPG